MAGNSGKEIAAEEDETKRKVKKKDGVLSRVWNTLFRFHGDDVEKRLQRISKEEAAVVARMKRRARGWGRVASHLIIFSVSLEVIAVGYAITATRSLDLNWKMRALRVFPVFLLPALASIVYSGLVKYRKICDRRDQKCLESLRAERQAKIDELKEKTNYYITQQLIQRYDSDPAAKAAAATVLASKLGADSNLRVYVEDESKLDPSMGKSHVIESAESRGPRNRKHMPSSADRESIFLHSEEEILHSSGNEGPEGFDSHQLVGNNHHSLETNRNEGGWIARIAALLVGEDPRQCYALICSNCHMHNGLARKEDFLYITYYCPHCNALNKPKQLDEHATGLSSPTSSHLAMASPSDKLGDACSFSKDGDKIGVAGNSMNNGVTIDGASNSMDDGVSNSMDDGASSSMDDGAKIDDTGTPMDDSAKVDNDSSSMGDSVIPCTSPVSTSLDANCTGPASTYIDATCTGPASTYLDANCTSSVSTSLDADCTSPVSTSLDAAEEIERKVDEAPISH